jgi:hypothetical protein
MILKKYILLKIFKNIVKNKYKMNISFATFIIGSRWAG